MARLGRPRRRSSAAGTTHEGGEPDAPDGAAERPRKAEAYALDLLALRPRTVRELHRRLEDKGYPEATVAEIVGRCLRAGYLDDVVFARQYVEERCRSFACGPARLGQELRLKGVSPENVATVLGETMPPERERDLAVALAAKKRRGRSGPAGLGPGAVVGQEPVGQFDRRAGERLWSLLRRRGFGTEACRAAMRSVFGPADELYDTPEEDCPADDEGTGPSGAGKLDNGHNERLEFSKG